MPPLKTYSKLEMVDAVKAVTLPLQRNRLETRWVMMDSGVCVWSMGAASFGLIVSGL